MNKNIIYKIFFVALYLIATYLFWFIILPMNPPIKSPDYVGDGVLEFVGLSTTVTWFTCVLFGVNEKLLPSNPNLATKVIFIGTIISPIWWLPIGLVILLIKVLRNTGYFLSMSKFTAW